MRTLFRQTLLAIALTVITAGPAAAQSLERMVQLAEAGHWTMARDAARALRSPAAAEAYEWLRLRASDAQDFRRMALWVSAHPGWPDARRIQARGERGVDDVPVADVIAFFDAHPPVTGAGTAVYAMALLDAGRVPEAVAAARLAWLERDLTASIEDRMLRAFPRTLRPLQDDRLDALIWRDRLTAARRQLSRASPSARALGETRIALLKSESGVNGMIARLPRAVRGHPGLLYGRMRWRKLAGLEDGAEEMMLAASPGQLGRPTKWADERAIMVRAALEKGRLLRGAQLAAGHGLTGARAAEFEWLAGWAMVRRRGGAAQALGHFERGHQLSERGDDRAQMAYWAAEAAEKLGRADLALQWRMRAAADPTAYYGQLAAQALGRPAVSALPTTTPENGACVSHPMLSVGEALLRGGATLEGMRFFRTAAELCATRGQIEAVARRALSIGASRAAISAAAAVLPRGGPTLPAAHPPRLLPSVSCGGLKAAERALVTAIARRESGFDETAQSSAGARGLMQVMPGTARVTAQKAGLRYDLGRLGRDGAYNAKLGSCYLAELLDQFEGAYPLALAAYNAGPSRVTEWLDRFGDPRRGDISMVHWIESIPFRETRGYVKKVLTSLEIYRFLNR